MSLQNDPDLIRLMEQDLRSKVQFAIDCNPDLRMVVHGVFSIEDLEQKLESELSGAIGVGVQYVGMEKIKTDASPGRNSAVRMLMFSFATLLAVPTTEGSEQRHDATKLLTVVRNSILGKPVCDSNQRAWDIVREQPEPSASTPTMLYYSQVWQVAIPAVGNSA